MATNGPDPKPCDKEIFQKGKPVAVFDAPSNAAENWVQAIAKKANARVDWHYSGGGAQLLHLGDDESRTRVEVAIDELESTLKGRILHRYTADQPGMDRNGVTQAPAEAVAGCFDQSTGGTTYIISEEGQE